MFAAIPWGWRVLDLRWASIKEIALSEALRRLRTLPTPTYICIKKCTHSRVFIRTLLQKKHFLSKPWNDWWLNMYTALHLTVKPYGNEWNQMEKHLRCNMKISKSSSPYLGNLTSTSSDTHHPPTWDSAAQSGDWCHCCSTLSVSRSHPSSAPRDESKQYSFPFIHGVFLMRDGQSVCVADDVQINLDK